MSAQLEKSRAEIALSLNKTKYLPLNKQWWRGQQYKVLRSIWQERAGEAAARAQVRTTAQVAGEHSGIAGWGSRCWTPRYTRQHKLLRSLRWKQAMEAAPRLLESDLLERQIVCIAHKQSWLQVSQPNTQVKYWSISVTRYIGNVSDCICNICK